jgi:hypothetical protein
MQLYYLHNMLIIKTCFVRKLKCASAAFDKKQVRLPIAQLSKNDKIKSEKLGKFAYVSEGERYTNNS